MNAMGHNVPSMIGVDQKDVVKQLNKLVPGYMALGENGMNDMTEMDMELPDNTLPMMTGTGPFGAIGMGGMFTVLKVRRDQPRNSHADPGWYRQPPGTQARLWQQGDAPLPEAPQARASAPTQPGTAQIELQVRKPSGHQGH
jgi:hypothetical protein